MRTTTATARESRMGSPLATFPTLIAVALSAILLAACANGPTAPTMLDASNGRTVAPPAPLFSGYQPPDPCNRASCGASATVMEPSGATVNCPNGLCEGHWDDRGGAAASVMKASGPTVQCPNGLCEGHWDDRVASRKLY